MAEQLLETIEADMAGKSSRSSSFASSFALLCVLYMFQGVPLGLAGGAIPFLLKAAGASYSAIGLFGLAMLPFSLKLAWAPVVDGFWMTRLGRRKTWILPCQIFSGLFMMALAAVIDDMVRVGSMWLAPCFFILVLAFATQDIAVDGWALTILSEHLSYASTAQSVGQNIGFFCGFTVFLGANSFGWISLGQFVFVWGAIFVASSVLLFLFKHEPPPDELERVDSVAGVYKQLLVISRLPDVRRLVLFLMTYQIGFVATDKALHLRLIEVGFSKELLATLGLVGLPMSVLFAVITGRWARGGNPMTGPFFYGNLLRVVAAFLGQGLLWYSGDAITTSVGTTTALLCIFAVATLASSLVFVSVCAFFNEISPKEIGGTYLTMLNTISNLGKSWSGLIVLSLIDYLGFSVVNIVFLSAGTLYLLWSRPYLAKLETPNKMTWSVDQSKV